MSSMTLQNPLSSIPATVIQSSTSLPRPRTPSSGGRTLPEGVSSPESPQRLETPHTIHHSSNRSSVKGGRVMETDLSELENEDFGLGFGDLGADGWFEKAETDVLQMEEESMKGLEEDMSGQAGPSSASMSLRGRASFPEEDNDIHSFPSQETLKRMLDRLRDLEDKRMPSQVDDSVERDELISTMRRVLTPVLEQMPFLQGQVIAQRETIVTIQQQAKLSEKLMTVERERHAAERAGWYAETRALAVVRDTEIAAGIRPNKLLDLDVGYHQELEAANKRLEMDNRLMAPRLADTQRQIDKLVNELRHLRSHVVLSSQSLADLGGPSSHSQADPQIHPSQRAKSASPMKASTHTATMGDARTEHLLLAARKVRAMRQVDDRVGRLTLEELKRGGVIGPEGGLGYSEGYGGVGDMDDDEDDYESEVEDEKPIINSQSDRRPSTAGKGKGKGGGSAQATPLLPRAKRSSKRSLPPPTTPRSRSRAELPETTPGGTNFNDLLRAAELATRPGTPAGTSGRVQHVPMSAMSATRSTTRAREESTSDRGSPNKRARREPPSSAKWTRSRRISGMDVQEEGVEGEDVDPVGFPTASDSQALVPDSQQSQPESFALDLLAQASQLDVAQSASQGTEVPLASATRFGGMLQEGEQYVASPSSSQSEIGLAPPIDLKSGPSTVPAPIEDYQIDPALSGLPRPRTAAETPKPRAQSISSDIHTPARAYYQHVYPTPDNPFDETPGRGGSPPYSSRNDMLSNELPLGAFASPTGATVPGLGKYVHLTSSMPARRVRSPYLKWTVEEDELLARAVAMHGEKWDLVSKGVPTRSYHQVRQRWLRKTGAFDKKPSISDLPHGISGLGQEEEEEETSPTPGGGTGRKRKS